LGLRMSVYIPSPEPAAHSPQPTVHSPHFTQSSGAELRAQSKLHPTTPDTLERAQARAPISEVDHLGCFSAAVSSKTTAPRLLPNLLTPTPTPTPTPTHFVFPPKTLINPCPSSTSSPALESTSTRPERVYCHIPTALFLPFPPPSVFSRSIYARLMTSATETSLGVASVHESRVDRGRALDADVAGWVEGGRVWSTRGRLGWSCEVQRGSWATVVG
jgi:hypothetical protein